jgi:hypothetical protein
LRRPLVIYDLQRLRGKFNFLFYQCVLGHTNGYGIPDAVVDEVVGGVEGRDEGDGEGEGDKEGVGRHQKLGQAAR